jgi:hypothetical protein
VEERFGKRGVLLLEERVGAVRRWSQAVWSSCVSLVIRLLVHIVLEKLNDEKLKSVQGLSKIPLLCLSSYCQKVYFHFLNLDMPILQLACSTIMKGCD